MIFIEDWRTFVSHASAVYEWCWLIGSERHLSVKMWRVCVCV